MRWDGMRETMRWDGMGETMRWDGMRWEKRWETMRWDEMRETMGWDERNDEMGWDERNDEMGWDKLRHILIGDSEDSRSHRSPWLIPNTMNITIYNYNTSSQYKHRQYKHRQYRRVIIIINIFCFQKVKYTDMHVRITQQDEHLHPASSLAASMKMSRVKEGRGSSDAM